MTRDDIRATLAKPEGYAEPIMYDIGIDSFRYVTQSDIDLFEIVSQTYGSISEIVKAHSRKIAAVSSGELTPDF